MKTARFFACLVPFAIAALLPAQTPSPSAYTITESIAFPPIGSTMTIYRSGTKVLTVIDRPARPGSSPAQHTRVLYDLASGTSWSWDPAATSVSCTAAHFSANWADPFAMTPDLRQNIAKGEFKPAGTESIAGVSTTIYTGVHGRTAIKAWFDEKDGLVMRAMIGAPGGQLQPLVDIKKVDLTAPTASLFALPAACAR
ncbi:MAG TPA: hypothetical protein VGG56_09585 [Terracidiphilus sp.]|jgi:hypothetical protein